MKAWHQPNFIDAIEFQCRFDHCKVMVVNGIEIGSQQTHSLFSIKLLVNLNTLLDSVECFGNQFGGLPTTLVAKL
jgi:hypothetical protein